MRFLKILIMMCSLTFVNVFANGPFTIDAPPIILIKPLPSMKIVSMDFCYLEISTFPTRIKDASVGGAVGYRVAHGYKDSTDFSFHAMRTLSKDLIYCGKINHLYYLVDKTTTVCPYIGFGFILGLAAPKTDGNLIDSHYHDTTTRDKEYVPFMNGEIVVGTEFVLNAHRQFVELTYYAGSSTLQLSLGIGL